MINGFGTAIETYTMYDMCQMYAHMVNRQVEQNYIANPPTDDKGKVTKIKYIFYTPTED
jgi:predicted GTPase